VSSCEAECIMKCLLLGILTCTHFLGLDLKASCKVTGKICCAMTAGRAALSLCEFVEDVLSNGK
jgi:hypothetical protein